VDDVFRLLVTGHRDWSDAAQIGRAMTRALASANGRRVVVVHGACQTGVDHFVEYWCKLRGIATEPHPAQWRVDGKLDRSAGPKRNSEMVAAGADCCLAFWDGSVKSGTFDCLMKAVRAGITVRIIPRAANASGHLTTSEGVSSTEDAQPERTNGDAR